MKSEPAHHAVTLITHQHAAATATNVDDLASDAVRFWGRPPSNVFENGPTDEENSGHPCGPIWRLADADCHQTEGAASARFVSLTFPRLDATTFLRWLGPRLVVWPNGIPSGRRISVVSSTLTKRKDTQREWFDHLRTAVLRSLDADNCLSLVAGTTTSAAVRRACRLFGIPHLLIDVSGDHVNSASQLAAWLGRMTLASVSSDGSETMAWISPRLMNERFPMESGPVEQSCPDRDVTSFVVAERLVVLSCRRTGRIEQLACRHLNDASRKSCPLLLATATQSTQIFSEELVVRGAVPWLLEYPSESVSQPSPSTHSESVADPSIPNLILNDGPLQSPEQWLCHWTRPCYGPWTDQPEDEFLDELILGCDSADRSAIAALLRMLSQRKILPSAAALPDHATVSFTAVPLSEFRECRVYRRHRQRYDFEPWGIAVRRNKLEELGARPVRYLDPNERHSFQQTESAAEEKHFHPATDASGRINWSEEREWRFTGQLDLNHFGNHDLCVFVSSLAEVTAVQSASPWPVIVLP